MLLYPELLRDKAGSALSAEVLQNRHIWTDYRMRNYFLIRYLNWLTVNMIKFEDVIWKCNCPLGIKWAPLCPHCATAPGKKINMRLREASLNLHLKGHFTSHALRNFSLNHMCIFIKSRLHGHHRIDLFDLRSKRKKLCPQLFMEFLPKCTTSKELQTLQTLL